MHMKNFFNFRRWKSNKDGQGEKFHQRSAQKLKEVSTGDLLASVHTVSETVDQQDFAPKILTVQDGNCSVTLVDYAVKMAHRLNCGIIALDVSEEPLRYEGERRKRESNRFFQRALKSAETLQLKAEAMGIKCKHIIQIGNQEETIKALSQKDKTIRYVLTKPSQEQLSTNLRQDRIPDLGISCLRL